MSSYTTKRKSRTIQDHEQDPVRRVSPIIDCLILDSGYPSPPMSRPTTPQERNLTRTATTSTTSTTSTTAPLTALTTVASSASLAAPATTTPSVATARYITPSDYGVLGTRPPFASTAVTFLPAIDAAHFTSGPPSLTLTTTGLAATPTGARITRSIRRVKAHVASACVNCKRAHLSCDVQRPCRRCVDSGKQDTCYDIEHKKRGRPRLRMLGEASSSATPQSEPSLATGLASNIESRPAARTRVRRAESLLSHQSQGSESSSFRPRLWTLGDASSSANPQVESSLSIGSASNIESRPILGTRSRRAESFRSHRSQGSETSMFTPVTPRSATYPTQPIGLYFAPPNTPVTQELPTAFLDFDLVILRANNAFHQVTQAQRDLDSTPLHDVVAPADSDPFANIRNRLREERDRREPSYLPPIVQGSENILDRIRDQDVDLITQGYADHTHMWTSISGGNPFPARVRLAKSTIYFIVVTLPVQVSIVQQYYTTYGPAYIAPVPTTIGHSSSPAAQQSLVPTTTMPVQFFTPVLPGQQHFQSILYPVTTQTSADPYPAPRFVPSMSYQISPSDLQRQYIQATVGPSASALPAAFAAAPRTTGQALPGLAPAATIPAHETSIADSPSSVDEDGESSTRTPRKRRRLGINEVLQ